MIAPRDMAHCVEAIRHGEEPASEPEAAAQPAAPKPKAASRAEQGSKSDRSEAQEAIERDPGEFVGRRFDIVLPILVLWGGLVGSKIFRDFLYTR